MKFITKIEIKYFRSFANKSVKIENIKDLNIISGRNDAGKSNVLRALNLFFNNEVSHGIPFDFDRDFSKIRAEQEKQNYHAKQEANIDTNYRKSKSFVEIKCFFDLTERPFGTKLPQKFWISKKWTRLKNWEINSNIETEYKRMRSGETITQNQINSLMAQRTNFLKKIEFFYVPAIKDYFFFKELYAILQNKLTEASGRKIMKAQNDLQTVIKNETHNFFNKFKLSTNLDANFLMEHKSFDFRKNVEVETVWNILLTSRWDGIQARLIPDILEELTNDKKYTIWGFEEPENSYEMKNIINLKKEFIEKFSKNRQIFITTHSIEFLAIDSENSSIYRVWKDSFLSNIAYFDNTKESWDKYCDDFWIIKDARDINTMIEEKYKLEKMQNELLKEDRPIVLVEDEYDQIYKIAYLKLRGINCKEDDFESLFKKNSPFILFGKDGAQNLQSFLKQPRIDELGDKKFIGIFDFDAQWVSEFHGLQKNCWWKVDDKLFNKSEWWYKQRWSTSVYAMLLPVPACLEDVVSYSPNSKPYHVNENYLAIEELLNYNNLDIQWYYNDEKLFGWKFCYKKFNWDKWGFWRKLFNLSEEDFEHFKPLFKKIYELFWIEDKEWYFNS